MFCGDLVASLPIPAAALLENAKKKKVTCFPSISSTEIVSGNLCNHKEVALGKHGLYFLATYSVLQPIGKQFVCAFVFL